MLTHHTHKSHCPPLPRRTCPPSHPRSTIVESMMAPCGPVTFWHVIVADYLTSMAKAGQDLQLTACISAHIYTADHQGHAGHMSSTALWEEVGPDADLLSG